MSGLSSRWVPITMSTEPSASPAMTSLASLSVWKRRQALEHDREAAHPLGERREVLGDQQRRGHQHGDLLAVLHRLERRPHRDLGLAVADVAADQPVHRHRPPHVGLDLVDGGQLVGGLDERERVLELALPRACRARRREPLVACRAAYSLISSAAIWRTALRARFLRLVQSPPPSRSRRRLLAADVAGDLVERVGRHVEPVGRAAALGGAVLEDEVLARRALHLALPHLHEAADAVLLVHDVVAGLELERVDLLLAPGRHPAHVAGGRLLAGQVVAGQDREPERPRRPGRARGCRW